MTKNSKTKQKTNPLSKDTYYMLVKLQIQISYLEELLNYFVRKVYSDAVLMLPWTPSLLLFPSFTVSVSGVAEFEERTN